MTHVKPVTLKSPTNATQKTNVDYAENSVQNTTTNIPEARDYTIEAGKVSKVFRNKGQAVNFEQLRNVLLQNVSKTPTRAFNQYTKELVQGYLAAPLSNIDNLRSVSQFLWRVSASYRKIIEYTALMPLYLYNVTYVTDWTKNIDSKKIMKNFMGTLQRLESWDFYKMFSTATATALRDGMCVGFVYDNEKDGVFMQYLDPKYCKVSGISNEGNNVVSFNAAFFDSGTNKEFLYGVSKDDTAGIWDEIFVSGYETYKSQGRDYQWFELPIDRTLCVVAGDDPTMPLPYYITIFTDLLDILDFQSIVRSKTELQNFVLLYSKIPLIKDSEDVDDYALDIDTVKNFQGLIDAVLPDLVGSAYGATDLEAITFKDINNTDDTDIVSQSMCNLFSKVGISEMLFNNDKGGSIGLDASIKTDEAFAMRYLYICQSWFKSYAKNQITEDILFAFHPITRFSQKAYVDMLGEQVALGLPKQMDWATASGDTPYTVWNKTYMMIAMDINSLWVAPQSSWTNTSKNSGGQTKDDSELSDEGAKTKDKAKNKKKVGS